MKAEIKRQEGEGDDQVFYNNAISARGIFQEAITLRV